MCLYSKTNKPKIATEPIKVYKVLEQKSSYYYTPYQYYRMKRGEHYYETGEKFGVEKTRGGEMAKSRYSIRKGLHSFLDFNSAKGLAQCFHNHIVVEMETPKDSEYFIGDDGDIVSDNLIWHWDAKIHKV